LQAAFQQNERKKRERSAEEVLKDLQGRGKPVAATVEELTPAQAAKEEGNAAFKKGDYEQVPLSPHFMFPPNTLLQGAALPASVPVCPFMFPPIPLVGTQAVQSY
jgi:hypothetical protein